ncbi:hypothetical protein RFI_26396 [Reticulomyxa filosa]|uniref:Kelch motif family protein n=1 Tax=Reticulomyxa filosa TaxID=46433 RepID=X6MD69_RETFI|nr:hypothetical protein RFI_26396 [Reticulomyxa filosa]|eukprot:ETO10980.1 hypothetical protein RFI_26396 [Reticulomyxa filosa]
MANQTTTQEPPQHLITSTPFQGLKDLPIPLYDFQCVTHKHEILICGGYEQSKCYSYHTLKNQYKFICEYPSDITLDGYCVVKLTDNNNKDKNQITLLSFGGSDYQKRYTLVMKYVSVWGNDNNNIDDNEMNKSKDYNQWIPFTDNHNQPIIIGRNGYGFHGARAVIGGSNDHLLFITYYPYDISVFNLNTFQFIKHDFLPDIHHIRAYHHCFVLVSENEQETMKKNYGMLLFSRTKGLLILYDEDDDTFQFRKASVCADISQFSYYAYVLINDIILFFGGLNNNNGDLSKSVYKYSIQEDEWTTFQDILPSTLHNGVAILSEDESDIHIIGGQHDLHNAVSTHMKTKVRIWDNSQLLKNEVKLIIKYWIRTLKIKLGWIDDFDQIIFKYSRNI